MKAGILELSGAPAFLVAKCYKFNMKPGQKISEVRVLG